MKNENDLLQEKIIKREKTDTILAYILLVIVLCAIGFVVYLKFIKKEKVTTPTEESNNYITLNYIADELNDSTVLSKYTTDTTDFTITSTDDGIVLNYKNNDTNKDINVNVVQKDLEFVITNDEYTDFITDVYKETANIICKYYENNDATCESLANSISNETSLDGVRFVTASNKTYVYIDMSKAINTNSVQTYTEVTNVDITNKNYQLKFNDITIKDINIINSDTGIEFTGIIKGDSLNTKSIIVTLYDTNNTVIGTNKKEYTEDTAIDKFSISFQYSDNLKYESISKYSINIE